MSRVAKSWIIYVLAEPTGRHQVRYVGVTFGNTAVRLNQHIHEAQRALNSRTRLNHRVNWIASLLKVGRAPLMRLIERGVGRSWSARERYWIAEYKRRKARLVNGTVGGDAGSWSMMSPEQLAAIARKGGLVGGKRRFAGWTPQQISAYTSRIARAIRDSKTPDERRLYYGKVVRASHTPEAEAKRRIAVARQMSDPAQRNGLAKRMAAMTPERRREISLKAWATKRARSYVLSEQHKTKLGIASRRAWRSLSKRNRAKRIAKRAATNRARNHRQRRIALTIEALLGAA